MREETELLRKETKVLSEEVQKLKELNLNLELLEKVYYRSLTTKGKFLLYCKENPWAPCAKMYDV